MQVWTGHVAAILLNHGLIVRRWCRVRGSIPLRILRLVDDNLPS